MDLIIEVAAGLWGVLEPIIQWLLYVAFVIPGAVIAILDKWGLFPDVWPF